MPIVNGMLLCDLIEFPLCIWCPLHASMGQLLHLVRVVFFVVISVREHFVAMSWLECYIHSVFKTIQHFFLF